MKKKIFLKFKILTICFLIFMPISKASEFELKINTYKNFSKYLFIKNNLFLSYLTIENSIGTEMDIFLRMKI